MTDQEKTPEPVAAGIEGLQIAAIRAYYNALSPRLKRLLHALLDNPAGLSRESADRATPCSNSPEYISQLRDRLGLEIQCELVRSVTIDGESSRRGVYHLTRADRTKVTAAMS